ncbi:MAG: protein-tyrosine phosphatase [Ilumatobacter sp.]|jgi:protein-tyrosine phosphatase
MTTAVPLKILTVCSHNRTRSVMTMAMLQSMLDARLGDGAAIVRSLGFGPEDMPSIPDAVDAMKRRGFDTSGHRSRKVTADNVGPADLILTSERDHVVKIAAMSPQAYRQTMTLPEFLSLAELDDSPPGQSLRDWVASLTASRSARTYLNSDVGEIIDPTGSAPRAFEKSVVGMEEMCKRATSHIVRVAEPPTTANRFSFD